MSATPVFEITNISSTSFYIKQTPDVDVNPISNFKVTGTPYGTEDIINGSFTERILSISNALLSTSGMKVSMPLDDGIMIINIGYGSSIGIGATLLEDYPPVKILVVAKADLCIFAAIDLISLCHCEPETLEIAKVLYKISLKEKAIADFNRGNYTKADEALRLVCGKQPYSSSICNCE